MAIRVFQLKLTPTYSIYLLTTYYPQKGLNLLFLQRLDSYLKSLKFQFPSLTDLCSLYSFIFISFFVKFFVSSRYTKNFIIPDYCQCLHFICLFLYIYCLYRKNSPYFYCIQPRNISDKFTIIRDLCTFLHTSQNCSTTFHEKLGFTTANHKTIDKLNYIDLYNSQ